MTRKSVLLAVLLLLVAAGAIAAALAAPWFFSWAFWQEVFTFKYWQEGGDSTSRSEVFRNLGLAGIALGALIVGSIRALSAHRQARAANEQARIAQQGQFTERFSRSAEHLGSKEMPVRLGGIYALWRLVQDSPERDVVPVIGILCAFVRGPPGAPVVEFVNHAEHPLPAEYLSNLSRFNFVDIMLGTSEPANLRADVQIILDLICNTGGDYRKNLPSGYRIDFSRADLEGADLAHADLGRAFLSRANCERADFSHADLTGADFSRTSISDADFTGARLSDATFRGSYLDCAHLSEADFSRADFSSADLSGANLTDSCYVDAKFISAGLGLADLSRADLSEANFTRANLTDAVLTGANLTDANLTDADLTDAVLMEANLMRANLMRANLTDADLSGADLTDANLTDANLAGANLSGANLAGANLWGARNLKQNQLNSARVREGGKPPRLYKRLKPPKNVYPPRTQ